MPDEISKIQGEIMERRDKQLLGLKQALRLAFKEYRENQGELPQLTNEREVNLFLLNRPELNQAIQKLDLVLSQVTSIALKVLEEMSPLKI